MYPSFLYPGRTDRDGSGCYLDADAVEPLLDSVNPWSWWKIFKRIKALQPDLVIFPWWVSFWTPHFWVITSLVKHFTPAKVLFICHNVIEHEPTSVSKFSTKLVLKTADFCITHSDAERRRLLQLLPSAHVEVVFHPIYDVFTTFGHTDRNEARSLLEIHGPTALFFGFVRPYKGLRYLIDAMSLLPRSLAINLLIVGEFWDSKAAYLDQIRAHGLEASIKIVDRYVANEEVSMFFNASDVVILPYVAGTGSGIVQIAFAFDKPVIATRVGSFPEIIRHGLTGYLVQPGDSGALAAAIREFFTNDREAEMSVGVKREKAAFSWENLVRLIERLSVTEARPLVAP